MAIEKFKNKDMVPTFGTEFNDDNQEENFDSQIWNTELINELIQKVEEYGLDLNKVSHPFFEKNITLKRARTAYQLTDEELAEFKRCKKDIVYFANTYVKLMQEHGIDNVKLYPYQEEMLKMYQDNRYNCVLGSRQIGKCVNFDTEIQTAFGKTKIYKIWYRNLNNKTIFDRLKYILYKLYCKLS
jgi:hypothetical protein